MSLGRIFAGRHEHAHHGDAIPNIKNQAADGIHRPMLQHLTAVEIGHPDGRLSWLLEEMIDAQWNG